MVFGRKKGLLSSWSSSRAVETEADLEVKAKAQTLEAMHKTLREIHLSMQTYLASWHAMCQASRTIAEGLEKLANGGASGGEGSDGVGANGDGKAKTGVVSLMHMARLYNSAQHTIDGFVREPAQRVVEGTTLRETGALLSRFPPIFGKIARRKQLLAEVEAARSKVRTAEAAKDKERDSFSVVAGTENRRRLSTALATAVSVADGVTAEVLGDIGRLERERGAMLVPQVSALVGSQAYFMRRSAAVLERLAGQLPYSALALCRLVRPHAASRRQGHPPAPPPRTAPKSIDYSSSSSTIHVDASAHSLDSPVALSDFDGGGGSGSSITGLGSSQHQHQHQHQQITTTAPAALDALDFPVNGKREKASRSASAGPPRVSSPPPPPPRPAAAAAAVFGASRHSNPFASTARPPTAGAGAFRPVVLGAAAAAATTPAPLVERWAETGAVAEEVAVQEWAVTGRDDGGGVGEI